MSDYPLGEFSEETHGLFQTQNVGDGTVQATLTGITGSLDISVRPPTFRMLRVTPSVTYTYPGATPFQLTATAYYTDNSSYNVTPYVTWGSSNTSRATVSSSGLVTPLTAGTVVLTASISGVVAYAHAVIRPIYLTALVVTPNPATLTLADSTQFTATGTFSDGTTQDLTRQCMWVCSNDSVLHVTLQGVGQAVTAGTCQVAAVNMTYRMIGYADVTVTAGTHPPEDDSGDGGEGGWGTLPAGGQVFMCCETWDHILVWDRGTAVAEVVETSPANVRHMAWYNGNMYGLSGSTLWFSDASDPYMWPTQNNIPLALTMGPPRFLKATSDRLLIFCANGILAFSGDPEENPYVSVIIPDMPCSKGNVTFDGGAALMISYQNLVVITGGANVLSNAVTGLPLSFPTNVGLAACPEYAVVRTKDIDGATLVYVYDRLKYGAWSRWRYETGSVFGSTPPGQMLVAYGILADRQGFLIPSTNGNLYIQGFITENYSRRYPQGLLSNTDLGVPIIGAVGTRYAAFVDDYVVAKQLRKLYAYGHGTNVQVVLNFVDASSNCTSYAMPLSSTTLPVEQPTSLDGTMQLPCDQFHECQIVVSGENLCLRELAVDWRPLRYGSLQLGG